MQAREWIKDIRTWRRAAAVAAVLLLAVGWITADVLLMPREKAAPTVEIPNFCGSSANDLSYESWLDVDIEYRYVYVRIFITNEHCMLCRVHAADFGAIALTALVGTTAAYALDKHDLLGMLTVGEALKVTLCGTCSVHNSFKLKGSDNIL